MVCQPEHLAAVFFICVHCFLYLGVFRQQLPTHHCPFCLLQKEYHYIGYPLYLFLFGAGITGAGLGVIDRFKTIASLQQIVPGLQKRLVLLSMSGYLIFTAIASTPILFSGFKLEGY